MENTEELFEDIDTQRCSCFAHTLQLVIKDGFTQAEQLRTIVGKAARFVAHTHRSTKATEILESCCKLKVLMPLAGIAI